MKYNLKIGWLYPDLMSTYGDYGNILTLQKRSIWRGIDVSVISISNSTLVKDIESVDLFFGGGAQDREQEIVMKDLHLQKGKIIKKMIEKEIPALFVCGAPQLMGQFYEVSPGKRIEGLGIFDMESIQPRGSANRLVGNIAAKLLIPSLNQIIFGFENHAGRSYLKSNSKPLAKVLIGNGNNGKDKHEGVIYKNALGSYLHGPLLPKNSFLADWLISKALAVKHNQEIILEQLDDKLENQARMAIANKLDIKL